MNESMNAICNCSVISSLALLCSVHQSADTYLLLTEKGTAAILQIKPGGQFKYLNIKKDRKWDSDSIYIYFVKSATASESERSVRRTFCMYLGASGVIPGIPDKVIWKRNQYSRTLYFMCASYTKSKSTAMHWLPVDKRTQVKLLLVDRALISDWASGTPSQSLTHRFQAALIAIGFIWLHMASSQFRTFSHGHNQDMPFLCESTLTAFYVEQSTLALITHCSARLALNPIDHCASQ